MTKKIVAVFLSVLLLLPMGAIHASAGAFDLLSGVGSVSSIIGAGISILQVAGVFKDDTAEQLKEIKGQLKEVNSKLDTMNSKLNEMSNRLSNIEKQLDDIKNDLKDVKKEQIWDGMYSIINLRNTNAGQMKESWRSFITDYKEPMDKYLAQYTSMITSGIASWCEHPDCRDDDIINNSSIIVAFEEKDGELVQEYTYQNDTSAYDSDEKDAKKVKYVVIDSSLLPEAFIYEADTYQSIITDKIKNSILAAAKNGFSFKAKGFSEFAPESQTSMTDEFAGFIANAAFNELVYRIACIEVNLKTNASFISTVKTAFNNYITHLFNQEEGIDAFIQAQYMTHTFEYELKGTLTDFCDNMSCMTAVYGLLTSDLMTLSRATPDKDNAIPDFLAQLDEKLKKINLIGEQSYTGYDNYCYITNSLIHLGKIDIDYTAKNVKERVGISRYSTASNKTTQKIPGKEFDSGSKKIKSSAALLMLKCSQSSTGDFGALLKEAGAWDYDDLQNSLGGGNILLEKGGESKIDGTEKLGYAVYDGALNTVSKDKMNYNTATTGNVPRIIRNYSLTGNYLDTVTGDIEIEKKVAGFLLVNFSDKDNPLRLCATPCISNTKYECDNRYATISATTSVPYLYQTELPYDALGELSPLRHINNLYLSSVYSEGKPWLIITLGCVALAAVGTVLAVVLIKKKKSKRNKQIEDEPVSV